MARCLHAYNRLRPMIDFRCKKNPLFSHRSNLTINSGQRAQNLFGGLPKMRRVNEMLHGLRVADISSSNLAQQNPFFFSTQHSILFPPKQAQQLHAPTQPSIISLSLPRSHGENHSPSENYICRREEKNQRTHFLQTCSRAGGRAINLLRTFLRAPATRTDHATSFWLTAAPLRPSAGLLNPTEVGSTLWPSLQVTNLTSEFQLASSCFLAS